MNVYCVVGTITGGERLKPYLLFKKIEHFVLSGSGDHKNFGHGPLCPCTHALEDRGGGDTEPNILVLY